MKKQFLVLFFLSFFIISCKEQSPKLENGLSNTLLQKIEQLQSPESKSAFLYDLWHQDQGLRKGEGQKIINQFGRKSKEYKDYISEVRQKDRTVFLQMKSYLEIHGYPKEPNKYHELSINAIPIIIGHNHKYEEQKELLPYVYQGYKEGHCPLENIVWILHEMYESKHQGKHYQMSTSRYKTEQEFEELKEALGIVLD